MNRFQITAEIATTVLIGKFAHGAPLLGRVTYNELQKLFEGDGQYFPISSLLKLKLSTLKEGIGMEFMANLYEDGNPSNFELGAFEVILPMDGTANIYENGEVTAVSRGFFKAVVEVTGLIDDVSRTVGHALDGALSDVCSHCECLTDWCRYSIEIRKIGD